MIKKISLIAFFMIFTCIIFASDKIIIKEGSAEIPEDKTQNQVVQSLINKLKLEVAQDNNTFIKSNSNINSNTMKDDITDISRVVIKDIKKLEQTTFTKNNKQYVKVKLRIKIDTKATQNNLKTIKNIETYKKKDSVLENEYVQLINQLKRESEKQYNKNNEKETEIYVNFQKERESKLNQMKLKAQKEYTKLQKEQNEKNLKGAHKLKNLQDLVNIERQKRMQHLEQELRQIKKEKDEITSKIKQFETTTVIGDFTIPNSGISIQNVLSEVNKILREINEIKNEYRKSFRQQKKNIESEYNKSVALISEEDFNYISPKKSLWKKEQDYQNEITNYNKNKRDFYENRQDNLQKVKIDKEESITKLYKEYENSFAESIAPYIARLQYLQDMGKNKYYFDGKRRKANIWKIRNVNLERKYFILPVKYAGKLYKLKYDFSDMDPKNAQALAETKNRFIVEPLFSFEIKSGNAKEKVLAFDVRHLGFKSKKRINANIYLKEIDVNDKIFKLF